MCVCLDPSGPLNFCTSSDTQSKIKVFKRFNFSFCFFFLQLLAWWKLCSDQRGETSQQERISYNCLQFYFGMSKNGGFFKVINCCFCLFFLRFCLALFSCFYLWILPSNEFLGEEIKVKINKIFIRKCVDLLKIKKVKFNLKKTQWVHKE